MSEFSKEDALKWLQLAWDKHCSIHDAIYYSLFWECRSDDRKAQRAFDFFSQEMGLKLRETLHK